LTVLHNECALHLNEIDTIAILALARDGGNDGQSLTLILDLENRKPVGIFVPSLELSNRRFPVPACANPYCPARPPKQEAHGPGNERLFLDRVECLAKRCANGIIRFALEPLFKSFTAGYLANFSEETGCSVTNFRLRIVEGSQESRKRPSFIRASRSAQQSSSDAGQKSNALVFLDESPQLGDRVCWQASKHKFAFIEDVRSRQARHRGDNCIDHSLGQSREDAPKALSIGARPRGAVCTEEAC